MSEPYSSKYPLHAAAADGDIDAIRAMVATGQDVSSRDQSGNQPIHEAAWTGELRIVEYLLANGVRTDARGWLGRTALHAACRSPSDTRPLVRFLVDDGADVNALDDTEKTPIFRCCEAIEEFAGEFGESRFLENAQLLLERGAERYLVDRHNETALDHTSRESMRKLFLSYDS